MLPLHYKLSVANQADHHGDAPAFRLHVHSPRAVGATAKYCVKSLLPWAAALTLSSMLAYALNLAVVGDRLNSSRPSEALFVSTPNELADISQVYTLDACLTAWIRVSAERPDIYAAGLEQFVDSGCSAPTTRRP
jgi:hypothetical protein